LNTQKRQKIIKIRCLLISINNIIFDKSTKIYNRLSFKSFTYNNIVKRKNHIIISRFRKIQICIHKRWQKYQNPTKKRKTDILYKSHHHNKQENKKRKNKVTQLALCNQERYNIKQECYYKPTQSNSSQRNKCCSDFFHSLFSSFFFWWCHQSNPPINQKR